MCGHGTSATPLDSTHAWDDGAIRNDGASDVVGEWLCGNTAEFNGAMPAHRHLRTELL